MQETITLVLPFTKAEVTVKGYLTTGQSRELQKVLLSKGILGENGVDVKNVSPEAALDMQDKAAELLIKSVKNPNGETTDFSGTDVQAWLYDLPVADGNFLYEEINKIISATNLTEEAKKK